MQLDPPLEAVEGWAFRVCLMELQAKPGWKLRSSQGVVLCTLRFCTLGFGSKNHGIWPLTKGI